MQQALLAQSGLIQFGVMILAQQQVCCLADNAVILLRRQLPPERGAAPERRWLALNLGWLGGSGAQGGQERQDNIG